mmetsp:Transcript_29184/g.86346  ORF Transcript_29184/g.86346 Transcript_29184/m.86346 type:complete len:206 (-) Transcript_29184:42-659(-)
MLQHGHQPALPERANDDEHNDEQHDAHRGGHNGHRGAHGVDVGHAPAKLLPAAGRLGARVEPRPALLASKALAPSTASNTGDVTPSLLWSCPPPATACLRQGRGREGGGREGRQSPAPRPRASSEAARSHSRTVPAEARRVATRRRGAPGGLLPPAVHAMSKGSAAACAARVAAQARGTAPLIGEEGGAAKMASRDRARNTAQRR